MSAVVLCALAFSALVIPSEYVAEKAGFTGRWTMGLTEFVSFPTAFVTHPAWLDSRTLIYTATAEDGGRHRPDGWGLG